MRMSEIEYQSFLNKDNPRLEVGGLRQTLLFGKRKKKANFEAVSEKTEHITLVNWLIAHNILFISYMGDLPFIVKMPKQDYFKIINSCKAKGYLQSGIPDFFIFLKNQVIAIELKNQNGGVVSQAQKDKMAAFEKVGVQCLIANGANEAIQKIEEYLKN